MAPMNFWLAKEAVRMCHDIMPTFNRPVFVTFGHENWAKASHSWTHDEAPLLIAPPADMLHLTDPDAAYNDLRELVLSALAKEYPSDI